MLIAPFVALCVYNRDKWFIGNTTKTWMGLIVGLIYIVLIMSKALKEINKNLQVTLTLCVATCISYFLSVIIADLTWVMMSGVVGWVLFMVFDAIAKRDLNYYKTYVEEHARVEARKEAQESNSPYSAM